MGPFGEEADSAVSHQRGIMARNFMARDAVTKMGGVAKLFESPSTGGEGGGLRWANQIFILPEAERYVPLSFGWHTKSFSIDLTK